MQSVTCWRYKDFFCCCEDWGCTAGLYFLMVAGPFIAKFPINNIAWGTLKAHFLYKEKKGFFTYLSLQVVKLFSYLLSEEEFESVFVVALEKHTTSGAFALWI